MHLRRAWDQASGEIRAGLFDSQAVKTLRLHCILLRLTLDVEVCGQVGMDDYGVAKRTLFGNSLELEGGRVEARPQRLHEEQVLLFGELDQGFRLRGVGCGRFLAQDVLSGIQRLNSVLVVEGMRGP